MSLKYENLIRKMTLAEKAIMMSGKNTWETVDFEKYGIPSMVMSDGPHGLRRQAGAGDHLGLNASLPATCFPTAVGVANSWDEALGEEIGEALAEEAVTMGVNVILGPGLNIKRSPLCGRNFEYFSEDPYHAGKMAAAYVRGIQRSFVFRSKGKIWYQAFWYLIAFCIVTCIVNSINCIWVAVAGMFVPGWLYNIGTTVLNGGVSMVVFFFVNKIIFPEGEAK